MKDEASPARELSDVVALRASIEDADADTLDSKSLSDITKKVTTWALKHFIQGKSNVAGVSICKRCNQIHQNGELFTASNPVAMVRHLYHHGVEVQLVPQTSEYVKAVVFGGLDGIMTTFAIVNAAAGSNFDWKTILLLGISNAFADGFSMGFGEFVSANAERDHALSERERERWEVENCLDFEIKEMVDLYTQRGFSEEEAAEIVRILQKNHDVFVDFMMIHELGIYVDVEDKWGPLKQGIVMFLAFITFGAIPTAPYFSGHGVGTDATYLASIVVTGISLVLLGLARGHLTGFSMVMSAMIIAASGAASGAISYTVGLVVNAMIGGSPTFN
jgi:VIT1/CCC1 family predicted Fe2+/Mn2+ transporter